jgi:FtsH-binding integral membrane protein
MDYTNYNQAKATTVRYDEGLRTYMLSIYNYMTLALALTGLTAYFAAQSQVVLQMLGSPMGFVIVFAPLGIALYLSSRLNTISVQTAKALYWAYAGLLGLSLAPIFLVYTGSSIARTFFITASLFGTMSIYGYSTKRDLTGFGSFFMMGLIGIIIASLVNFFLKSTGLEFAISAIGVLIFTGLAAYDTQKLKNLYFQLGGVDSNMATKISIIGALTLYMDFINIFLFLLRFMGDRRSN